MNVSSSGLDCPICMRVLYEPVSTSCGHSFCKTCFRDAMDYKQECPTCRSHCATSLGVNVALAMVVRERFPEEYLIRLSEEEQRTRSASVESIILPVVFIPRTQLLGLVPGANALVLIIDTKSKQTLSACVGDKVCFYSENDEMGIVTEVVSVQSEVTLPDSALVFLRCVSRCELVSSDHDTTQALYQENSVGQTVARISSIEDEEDVDFFSNATERSLLIERIQAIKQWIDKELEPIGQAGKSAFVRGLVDTAPKLVGSVEETWFLSDAHSINSLPPAYSSFGDESVRFSLLRTKSCLERVRGISSLLHNGNVSVMWKPLDRLRYSAPARTGSSGHLMRPSTLLSSIGFIVLVILAMLVKAWWSGGSSVSGINRSRYA